MSIGAGPMASNYPYGFADGVTIRGVPIAQTHPGHAFWLSNSSVVAEQGRAGADGNRGTFESPFATLNFAVSQCVAGRGDCIFIKPGHAETISSSTAMALAISGVAIIGMGVGALRPTFTLDTANTSTITVSANDVSFQNCVFIANFLSIAALFTLTTAKFFTVDNCEILDTSSALNFANLVATNTTSNAADGMTFTRNRVISLATSGAITLAAPTGTNDRWVINDNYYEAHTTNAGAVMPLATGKILTAMSLQRNFFNLQNAAGTATGYLITTNGTTNTGLIDGNKDHALPTTPLPVTLNSGFVYGLNYHSDVADLAGYLVPAADV